ncbi:EF-P lysine aminoacylase EpmA [Pleionea sp. CnH1-48]|uniref:EF-P lysine aminoacylase EpmA n=1 Tax=Pleionea sp. CnH1-48 TaxID=2954494 RepID=UPI002096DB82|nr:EF-P lysine aminoacylase EpmA [Pleionea sp. CnH1-48]MCO7227425.1 EF-P lysine aminoacylase EpmA [Pleionea sp. CnH1-48]
MSWHPSASIETLALRAQLMRTIREFFYQRDVLEVDTPALMSCSVTDPYMDALSLAVCGQQAYLQTSPEYAMKRLLAAGSGDIYQLSKAYRSDERGQKHQPEFALLEWYRTDWDHHQLMDEVYELVSLATGIKTRDSLSYREAFQHYLSIDIESIDNASLREFTEQKLGHIPQDMFRDDYLSLLFATQIEPLLGRDSIAFICDFPASQSALARLLPSNPGYAGRFEVYVEGIELANGFWELTDAQEQRARFNEDNAKRVKMGKQTVDIDESFMAALEQGLPECSGVALGFDRLMMLAQKQCHINHVVPFAL